MKRTQQFWLGVVSFIAAFVFVGLAIVGSIRSYSPVPFWDMWTGTLGFFMRVSEGDLAAWWEQHNEHRILLSRLLFWIDFKIFSGANWFLVLVNYLLALASTAMFYRIARERLQGNESQKMHFIVGCMITIWLFQWMQHENLTWAFQSAFFLAQLLPLCGLYWLQKSLKSEGASKKFFIAACFGAASAGTLANGVLALPLMTGYAVMTRQNVFRTSLLGVLSLLVLALYFFNYHAPPYHGTLTQALKDNPLGVLEYIFLYLGSPFYYIFGNGRFGFAAAILATFFLVTFSLVSCFKPFKNPKINSLNLALIFYVGYLAITALGTAGGRLIFGVNQALSYRYTTPALMAWATLALIWLPQILGWIRKYQKTSASLIAVLILIMFLGQIQAIRPQRENVFEKDLAALALELGVSDKKQINYILPFDDAYLLITNKASENNLSVFGMYPFKDLREQIGTFVGKETLPQCQGNLDQVGSVEGDNDHVTLTGWTFNPNYLQSPKLLSVIDASRKIVGFALTGWPRPDVAKAIHKNAFLSGFRGYMLKDVSSEVLLIRGDSFPCEFSIKNPYRLISPDSEVLKSTN